MTALLLRTWTPMIIGCAALATTAHAAEVIPPKPKRHFNDYASVVSAQTAFTLNRALIGFENGTTNEVYVVIYPTMQTDSSIEDYCYRITAAWHLGHGKLDNGIVLFVFLQEHKTRIEVRPGLEGALPDATCKQIIAESIAPKFKVNDYDGGLTSGVDAIFKATENEYNADKIYAAENARLAAAWTGWDYFFLVADGLFVIGYLSMGWNKIQRWRHGSGKAVATATAK